MSNINKLIHEYQKGENCFTWARAIGLSESTRDRDFIGAMVAGDSSQLKDFDENGKNQHEAHLTGRAAVNILTDRQVMAYHCFLSGLFKEGQNHLEAGRKALESYVESASLPPTYLEGMQWAFKGTEIYQVIAMAKSEASASEVSEELLSKTLQDVLELAKQTNIETRAVQVRLLGLYVIKYRFICKLTRCRGYKDKTLEALQLVADLEPDNYEWWLQMYQNYERQRLSDRKYVPGWKEKKALEKAMTLLEESGKIDTDVDSSYMAYVASEVRRNSSRAFKLNFGNLTFDSHQEAVDHLKEKAKLIFMVENNFGSPFAEAARVFSSILPEEYRDFQLATRCCERALEIRPHSSRARIQMGKVLEQQGSTKAAGQYLQVYSSDKTKAGALVDAVGIMLWDPLKFEQEIKECFAEVFRNDVFRKNEVHRKRLDFYKGIFYLMLEDTTEGIEQLKRAFDNVHEDCISKFYGPLCWKLKLDKDQKERIETTMDKVRLQDLLPTDLASKIQLLRTLLVVRQ